MEKLIFRNSNNINSPAKNVWDAITNPVITKQYMYNSEVISDWKTGSTIIWRDADSAKVYVKGIIKEIQPQKLLRTIDLSIDSGLQNIESNYSRVTNELKNENG